jgi:hypothetical protein
MMLAKQRNATTAGGGAGTASAGLLSESIDVSVPQASVVSVDSAILSTSDVAGGSHADSLDSAGEEAKRLARMQSHLNLLSSPTAASAAAGEMEEGRPLQTSPIAHGKGKGAVMASNEDETGGASMGMGRGIGIVPAPINNDPAGFVAMADPEGLRLMTGVEPPTTADADADMNVNMAYMGAAGGPEPGARAKSPGLHMLQGSNSVAGIEPLFANSGLQDAEADFLSTQVRNHLVKSIISGSALLQQTNPALSPETKNPAKPRNLVDGPDQNVARGFLKEPDPLPSPNRSKPLTAQQGKTLMVRTASMSSRDWLFVEEAPHPLPSPGKDTAIPQVSSDALAEAESDDGAGGDGPKDVVDSDERSVGGSVGGSVVSFLTADEPPPEATFDTAASSSISLVHDSLMNDSLVEKSLSHVLGEAPPVDTQVQPGQGDAKVGSGGEPSPSKQVYVPSVPSLVVKGYRTIPAILTEDSAIVPTAANTAAKVEIEARRIVQRAIMTDTLTSEANAARILQSESLAAGSLVGGMPSGSLQGSMSSNGLVVATVERHFDALAPPRYDPIGPASAMGLETIENHPRFKYTGLPGPKQQPVSHTMNSAVSTRAPDRIIDHRQERLDTWHSVRHKKTDRAITPVAMEDGFIGLEKVEQNLRSVGLDLRDSRELARTVVEQPPPFWLPRDLKKADSAIAHDRSNHINGWHDVKMLLESGRTEMNHVNDRASILMTIKRQEAFLERFKDYSMLSNMKDSNPEWLRFKHRHEELLPVGTKTQLGSFNDKFRDKKLKPKIGKFVPFKKKKNPSAE